MKTIKFNFLTLIAALALLTTSCVEDFTIRGNGITESDTRITSTFKEVKSSGAFDVHISSGDDYEVVVVAETNILPYIETDVYGNTLEIDIRGLHNIRNTEPMEVYITTPVLEGLKQSGSGEITTDYFDSPLFDVAVSGSGRVITAVDCHNLRGRVSGSGMIILSGIANDVTFKVSGSGRIDAFDMPTRDCDVTISGSGDVYTNVERFLDAEISGSGSIFYKGLPSINQQISGSGKIINDN